MKLIKEGCVPASICDPSVRLSVRGMFDLVQDLLTEMLGSVELDGVSMKRRFGCVWVFTRNRIQIDSALSWKEEYIAESYISSAKGAKMTVDTVLKDTGGSIRLYSRIEMCALDLASQKIRRIRDIGVSIDGYVETPEREIEFSRMRHEGLEPSDSVQVRSGDIDFIGHTNNVSYIRFIMNTYKVDELMERPVREIEIRYAGQTHEGDVLTVKKAEQDGREMFDVCLGDTAAVECEVVRSQVNND